MQYGGRYGRLELRGGGRPAEVGRRDDNRSRRGDGGKPMSGRILGSLGRNTSTAGRERRTGDRIHLWRISANGWRRDSTSQRQAIASPQAGDEHAHSQVLVVTVPEPDPGAPLQALPPLEGGRIGSEPETSSQMSGAARRS